MDALEYIEAGHEVSIADINPLNLAVARRAVNVIKPGALDQMYVSSLEEHDSYGFFHFSVVSMNGVLHHVKDAHLLLGNLAGYANGIWAMVYTDQAWRDVTKSEPPEYPEKHPQFQQFVSAMDENGHWATFYTKESLTGITPKGWRVSSWAPVEPDGWFAVATFEPKHET